MKKTTALPLQLHRWTTDDVHFLPPQRIVEAIKNLDVGLTSVLPHLFRHGPSIVDPLLQHGIIQAITSTFKYPQLVEQSPYAMAPAASAAAALQNALTFLVNITCDKTPPQRSLSIRTAVTNAILQDLLPALTDHRQLISGSKSQWNMVRDLTMKLIANVCLSSSTIPPTCRKLLFCNQDATKTKTLRKSIFRLLTYDMFGTQYIGNRSAVVLKILAEVTEEASSLPINNNNNNTKTKTPTKGMQLINDFLSTTINVQYVKLVNLKSSPELNGSMGRLINKGLPDSKSGRLSVILNTAAAPYEKCIQLKPENVVIARTRGDLCTESIPVYGTIGEHWCLFLHQCVLENDFDSQMFEYVSTSLYTGQGLTKGQPHHVECFAGTNETMSELLHAMKEELQNKKVPKATVLLGLLNILEVWSSAEQRANGDITGARDDVLALFVQHHGVTLLATMMNSSVTLEGGEQNVLRWTIVNKVMQNIQSVLHSKMTKKLLSSEAGKALITEAKDVLLLDKTMKKKKKKTTKKKKKKTHPKEDAHLKSFWNTLIGFETHIELGVELKERKKERKKLSKQSKQHDASDQGPGGICGGCNQIYEGIKLLKCSKCSLPYCSRECQKQDWKRGNHKVICKTRQHEQQSMFTATNNYGGGASAEHYHKKQSKLAQDLLFARMKDICVTAILQKDVNIELNNFIICLDLTKGWVKAMTFDAAVSFFEVDKNQSATLSILNRNRQSSSALCSALCLVPSHRSAQTNKALVLKSISKEMVMGMMKQLLGFKERLSGASEGFVEKVALLGLDAAVETMR